MQNRRNFLKGASGIVGVSALGGCATLEAILGGLGYQNPNVRITGMNITRWALSSLGTAFDIEIDNPNAVGFTLKGIQYGLGIDGNQLTSGKSNSPVKLKSNGISKTQLAFDFPLAESAQALMRLLTKKEVAYDLTSAFNVGTSDFSVDVPANKSGSMPLPSLPKFSVPSVKFTNVSLSGVGLRIVPELMNSNTFDLPIKGFQTNLKINGRNILKNKAMAASVLKANKKTPMPIDLNLSLSELGLSAMSIAQAPKLDWDIDFGLLSDKLRLPFKKSGQLKLT